MSTLSCIEFFKVEGKRNLLSSVFEMANKRSYDLGFKLKVIEKAEHIGNRPASRHFKVDERRIREWRKKKNTLKLESEASVVSVVVEERSNTRMKIGSLQNGSYKKGVIVGG